jgi:tripartite ATP-independent transporter DctP family solute receptor
MRTNSRTRWNLDGLRRWVSALLATMVGIAGGVIPPASATTTIKLGHLQAPANHQQQAAMRFAELLAQKTKGQYEVKVFPAAQLGSARDMLEAVRQGNLEMTVFGSDLLEPILPAMGTLGLPYIWDRERAHKLLSGDIGRELSDRFLTTTGVRIVAWGDLGEQSMLTTRATIRVPDDLKGLKMRVPEVPSTVAAFRVWGANPTVITFAEVYNALQTGVVDGAVMPPDLMVTSRLYEVAKQLALTRHLFLPLCVMISDKFLRAQPPDVQKAILDSAREAFEIYDRELYLKVSGQAAAEMKAKGVTITEPDREAFRKLVPVVWREFVEKVPGAGPILKAIQDAK